MVELTCNYFEKSDPNEELPVTLDEEINIRHKELDALTSFYYTEAIETESKVPF